MTALTINLPLLCLVFEQMAENHDLQDVLLSELSDIDLFCKLIKYPPIRDNMLKTFKVRSIHKSADFPACLFCSLLTLPFLVVVRDSPNDYFFVAL